MEATVATTIDTTPTYCDEEKCCNAREKADCIASYKRQIAEGETRVNAIKALVAALEGHPEVASRLNELNDLNYAAYF